MKPFRGIKAGILLAWVSLSSHASVPVTQVWEEIKTYYWQSGYQLEYEVESRTDERLKLKNLSIASLKGYDLATFSISAELESLELTTLGEAGVEVRLPKRWLLGLRDHQQGQASRVTVESDQLRMLLTRQVSGLLVKSQAEEISLQGNLYTVGSQGPIALALTAQLNDFQHENTIQLQQDEYSCNYQGSFGRVTFDVRAQQEKTGLQKPSHYKLTAPNALIEGQCQLPSGLFAHQGDFDWSTWMAAGADLQSKLTLTNGALKFTQADVGLTGSLTFRQGLLSSDLISGQLFLNHVLENVTGEVSGVADKGSQSPFSEIKHFTADAGRMHVAIPLRTDSAVQEVSLRIDKFDFSESTWERLNPDRQVSREPMHLGFNGQVKIGPQDQHAKVGSGFMAGWIPAGIQQLQLRELKVNAFAASLTGKGDFAFDHSQSRPDGLPSMQGKATMRIQNLNAGINGLRALGLIKPEQLSMILLMAGLATQPVAENTVASELEVLFDGRTWLNGVPLL